MDMTETATETGAERERVSKEKLMAELRTLVGDAEELLKATASQAGEKIAAVRAKAEESMKSARARLATEEAALLARANSAAKATDEFVRANPWKSVGIGAFIGFLLGILATRR